MIFALLFILAFMVGLVTFVLTDKWLFAVLFSTAIFAVTTFADSDASEFWGITLIFGLPIVFFASLLGAYVVVLRRGEDSSDESVANEENKPSGDDE